MTYEELEDTKEYLKKMMRSQKAEDVIDNLINDYKKEMLKPYAMCYQNIGSIRSRLTAWIIDHLNQDGQLVMSQRAVTAECRSWASEASVSKTIQALCAGDEPILVMKLQGVYELSPAVKEKFNMT